MGDKVGIKPPHFSYNYLISYLISIPLREVEALPVSILPAVEKLQFVLLPSAYVGVHLWLI